jgi:CRP-like cAMP-binding protein
LLLQDRSGLGLPNATGVEMDSSHRRDIDVETMESGSRRFKAKVTRLGDYLGRYARDEHAQIVVDAINARSDVYAIPHDARSVHRSPRQNHLLAALDADDYECLLPHLELVHLPCGRIVHEARTEVEHVFFPVTSIVSLLNELENGTSVEVSAVGHEGVVGVSAFMGGGSTTSRAVARSAGFGYRLRAHALNDEFDARPTLRHLFLRYAQSLVAQTAQTAVCHCHHSIEQQLCRVLLFTLDRVPTNDLRLTQDLIAGLLGVRRESVTAAAGKLQADGLIRYHRGHVAIVSRPGLESRVCECYAAVKSEHDRVFADRETPKRVDRSMVCRAAPTRPRARMGEMP